MFVGNEGANMGLDAGWIVTWGMGCLQGVMHVVYGRTLIVSESGPKWVFRTG